MFPEESAASGSEDTPLNPLNGVLEQYPLADVGIAAWNYYEVTRDRAWLRERGYPLLKETADFWTSRVARNGAHQFDILQVIAADEFGVCDDDAFTNAAARANLESAISAAGVLGIAPNPDWDIVRQNIRILRFPDGVTREHATYDGEQVKQADVNLLAYPLHEVTSPSAILRDLNYYEPRIRKNDVPAMTRSIFSILYARLGLTEKAYEVMRSGYEPNLRPPFSVFGETNTTKSVEYFATGAGGVLQALLYGFGGLEISPNGLKQLPTRLPPNWKSLTLTGVGPEHRTYVVH
jgi:trehalose/maltose hydrolase-like predicted phosphorylase